MLLNTGKVYFLIGKTLQDYTLCLYKPGSNELYCAERRELITSHGLGKVLAAFLY